MNVDDTLLLAYVDGDLSPERRAEVQAAAANCGQLAARLAAMQASALPYAAAFERQPLPEVPPGLASRVARLTLTRDIASLHRDSYRPRLAAAFLVGALLGGGLFNLWGSGTLRTSNAPGASAWVQAVAAYQALYSRETVVNVVEDHALTVRTVGELRDVAGLPVSIPDLRDAGLTFKRVQRLSFRDQAVAQLVYLPARGDPIALCLTREAGADQRPHAQKLGSMQSVTWRRDHVSYVLLGRSGQIDLPALGERIARGDNAPTLHAHETASPA